jgi:lipid II:glycine glycyltransferase (peptidoglycan interpeptide bridge formation enzyme)
MQSFTQTKEYLTWHQALGTKTFYKEFFGKGSSPDFQMDGESEKDLLASTAGVVLNLRVGKVLYLPYGPVFFKGATIKEKRKVVRELYELGKKDNCVFVRLESGSFGKSDVGGFKPPVKTFAKEGIFQPRLEWWLDIKGSEGEIFNRFSKDARYSIRRAEKEGVETLVVDHNFLEYFQDFLTLMKETSERSGYILHEDKYFEAVFNSLEHKRLKGFLVISRIDSKVVSVALVIVHEEIASYVFGGSRDYKRELGASYKTQWEAIKKAKSLGAEIYNFGGITDGVYGKAGILGITKFKKQFGGYAKYHGGFLDLPISRIKYFIYILRKMI